MAKFIYRMQSILDLKTKMEEQARMEFASARMYLDEEEEKLNALAIRKADYEEKGRRLRQDTLQVFEILENKQAIQRMDEMMVIQREAVSRAEQLLEEARARLQTAMQESKTQEKLREHAFEEFMREENARESKEIDELTSYRFGQRRMESSADVKE